LNHWLKDIEQRFRASANSDNASEMAKYMKGIAPFFGIKSADRRSIQKEWFKTLHPLERTEFWTLIHSLWEKNEREFQYLAVDLLNMQPKKKYHPEDSQELERLITTKSWWDTVDLLASNYLGKYLMIFPDEGKVLIEKWRHSDNLWLKRSCLIFQLKYGKKTDVDLLKSLILQFYLMNEFFIQKAIGWSLRQLSKSDVESVRKILSDIPLKGIALREAHKYL
jgi:3-methyladenine DNA glycosylase AlkD